MANTKLLVIPYAAGATGAEIALTAATPLTLTPPTGVISYRMWLHNPTGSGGRVYVIGAGSGNTNSGITAGEGETLSGLGPFFSTDLPQLISPANITVYLTWEGIKSEV